MTWRVAILAFAIMLSGATRPGDPRRARRAGRLPGDGVVMALLLVVGVVGAYRGTRHAPVGGCTRPRLAGRPAPGRRRRARLPAAAGHVRGAGAGHRRMLAGVDYVAVGAGRKGGRHGAVRLLRRTGAAVHAGLERVGAPGGQEAGYVAASLMLAAGALRGSPPAVGAEWWVYARDRAGRGRVRRHPGLPAGDAARRRGVDTRRTGDNRAGVYTGVWTAGETLGLALGRRSSRSCWPRRIPLTTSPTGPPVQPGSAVTAIVLGFSLLPCLLVLLSLVPLSRFSLTRRRPARSSR